MNLINGPLDGQWRYLSTEQARQWQQLSERHQLALLQLHRQQADCTQQLAELKAQLAEIRSLHRMQHLTSESGQ